jgi:hypothetical protein
MMKNTKKVPAEGKTPSEYAREISRQFCGVKVGKNKDGKKVGFPAKNEEKNKWSVNPEPLLNAVQQGKYDYIARQNCGTDEIVVDIDTGNEETDKWIRYCTEHPEEYLLFRTVKKSEYSEHEISEHWSGHVIFRGGSHPTMHPDGGKVKFQTYKIDILGNINQQGEPTSCLWNIKRNKYIEDNDIINLNAKIASLKPVSNWKDKILEFVDIPEFRFQPTGKTEKMSHKHVTGFLKANPTHPDDPKYDLKANNIYWRLYMFNELLELVNQGKDDVKHRASLYFKSNIFRFLFPQSQIDNLIIKIIETEYRGGFTGHYYGHTPVEHRKTEFKKDEKTYEYLREIPQMKEALQGDETLLIEAPAGAGKTTFVEETLSGDNVLFLTPRLSLIKDSWDTVQRTLYKSIKKDFKGCRVVVIDEIHAALAFDSTTNIRCLDWILHNVITDLNQPNIRLVMMSATLDQNVFNFVRDFNQNPVNVEKNCKIRIIDAFKSIKYRTEKVTVRLGSYNGGWKSCTKVIEDKHVGGKCDVVFLNDKRTLTKICEYFRGKGLKVGIYYTPETDAETKLHDVWDPDQYRNELLRETTDYDLICVTSKGELGNDCKFANLGKMYVISEPAFFDSMSTYQLVCRYRRQDKDITVMIENEKNYFWRNTERLYFTTHDVISGIAKILEFAKVEGDYLGYRYDPDFANFNLPFELLNFANLMNKTLINIDWITETEKYNQKGCINAKGWQTNGFREMAKYAPPVPCDDCATDDRANRDTPNVFFCVENISDWSEDDRKEADLNQSLKGIRYMRSLGYDDDFNNIIIDDWLGCQALMKRRGLVIVDYELVKVTSKKATSPNNYDAPKQAVKVAKNKKNPVYSEEDMTRYGDFVKWRDKQRKRGLTDALFNRSPQYYTRFYIIREAVLPETNQWLHEKAGKQVFLKDLEGWLKKLKPELLDQRGEPVLHIDQYMRNELIYTRNCPADKAYILYKGERKDELTKLFYLPLALAQKGKDKQKTKDAEIIVDYVILSEEKMRDKHKSGYKEKLRGAISRTCSPTSTGREEGDLRSFNVYQFMCHCLYPHPKKNKVTKLAQ